MSSREQKRVMGTAGEKKETAVDVVKGLLQWAVVSALSFVYWMAVLLLASLILMNVWRTSFEEILRYGILLAVITSVGYGAVLVRRRLK